MAAHMTPLPPWYGWCNHYNSRELSEITFCPIEMSMKTCSLYGGLVYLVATTAHTYW